MATYKNPWWSPNSLSPRYYETDVAPVEYRGYLIYRRLKDCFDVVKDGMCVSQFAGINGAKRRVDNIVAETNNIGE